MKTKEIDIWIDNTVMHGLISGHDVQSKEMYFCNSDRSRTTKAKLIIELPEKKIEITESSFDEAVYDAFHNGLLRNHSFNEIKQTMKQKLFGKDAG